MKGFVKDVRHEAVMLKIWGAFAIFMVFFLVVAFADLRIGDSAFHSLASIDIA